MATIAKCICVVVGCCWLAMSCAHATLTPEESVAGTEAGKELPPPTLVPQVGHDRLIRAVVPSPAGRLVATADAGGTVRIWDLDAQVLLHVFDGGAVAEGAGYGVPTDRLAFSADGAFLARWSEGRPLEVYDVAQMQRVRSVEVNGRMLAVRVEGGGEVVGVTSSEEGVWLRRFGAGVDVALGAEARAAAFAPGGTRIALARATGIDLVGEGRPLEPERTIATSSAPDRVEFSPDGHALAGLWLDELTVWDVGTGEAVLRGPGGVCSALAFAPDGGNVALGCEGRLWTLGLGTDDQVVGRTPGNVVGVAYTRGGREVVVARGTDLFVVDATFVATSDRSDPLAWTLFRSRSAGEVEIVAGRGRTIVADGTTLSVWDTDELRVAAHVAAGDKALWLAAPALGPGGRVAVAVVADRCSASSIPSSMITTCGQQGQERGKSGVVTLEVDTGVSHTAPLRDVISRKGWPEVAAVSADGARVVVAFRPVYEGQPTSLLVLDGAERRLVAELTSAASVRALHLSPDGQVLTVGTVDGRLASASLPGTGGALELPEAPVLSGTIQTIVGDGDELVVTAEGEARVAILEARTGRTRRMLTAEGPVVAAAPGTDGGVIAVDAAGGLVVWDAAGVVQPRSALAQAPPPGARLEPGTGLLIAPGNGVARATQLTSDASVWLASDPDHWLVWSDDGLFDGSRGATHLAAAVRGDRVFALDALVLGFNRPDLLLSRMGRGSDGLRARYARKHARRLEKAGLREEELADLYRRAPEARIVAWNEEGGVVTLTVSIRSQDELARYDLRVDGVPVHADGRPAHGTSVDVTEQVAVGADAVVIEVSATTQRGTESPRAVLHVQGTGEGVRQPTLYYLGFGVSKYSDARLDLGYAVKDVRDVGVLLANATPGASIHVFADDEVTPEAIEDAQTLLAEARPEDTVVVFLAGHGAHAPERDAYYFITHDTELDRLAETAASYQLIEQLIASTPARKRLVLLDTCESGDDGQDLEVAPPAGSKSRGIRGFIRPISASPRPTSAGDVRYDINRLIEGDVFRRSGAVVISSSRGSEASYEFRALTNGVFTHALKAALTSPDADRNGDGQLAPRELEAFLLREVAAKTEGKQHPTVDRDNPLSRVALPGTR